MYPTSLVYGSVSKYPIESGSGSKKTAKRKLLLGEALSLHNCEKVTSHDAKLGSAMMTVAYGPGGAGGYVRNGLSKVDEAGLYGAPHSRATCLATGTMLSSTRLVVGSVAEGT